MDATEVMGFVLLTALGLIICIAGGREWGKETNWKLTLLFMGSVPIPVLAYAIWTIFNPPNSVQFFAAIGVTICVIASILAYLTAPRAVKT
jgi:hypothetical protein